MKENFYYEATVNSPELDNFHRIYDASECVEDPRIFCSVDQSQMSPVHAISTADFRIEGQRVRLYVSDVEHQLRYLPVRFNANVECTEVYKITDAIWGMTVYFEE